MSVKHGSTFQHLLLIRVCIKLAMNDTSFHFVTNQDSITFCLCEE